MDLWSLIRAHGAWDVLAASVRDGVVLWRVVLGYVDALVGGLRAVFDGGVVCCGWDTSRVVATFGVMVVIVGVVVILLARAVWRFTAGAQILSLLVRFEFQFLCHDFEICKTEVESCEHRLMGHDWSSIRRAPILVAGCRSRGIVC